MESARTNCRYRTSIESNTPLRRFHSPRRVLQHTYHLTHPSFVRAMVILITGVTGFIGRHLANALRKAGHRVIGVSRKSAGPDSIRGDFTRDLAAETWIPRLKGVDFVINAVGILREAGDQTFDAVHNRAPRALFEACVAGWRRARHSNFSTGRRHRHERLLSQQARCRRVSRVATARLDDRAAVACLWRGWHERQALHDVRIAPRDRRTGSWGLPRSADSYRRFGRCRRRALQQDAIHIRKVALVGPRSMPFRTLLLELRAAMRLGRTLVMSIPMSFMRIGARIAELSPRSLLDRDTLSMLEAGNVADPHETTQLTWSLPTRRNELHRSGARLICGAAGATGMVTADVSSLHCDRLDLDRHRVARAVSARTKVSTCCIAPAFQPRLAPLLLYGAAALDLAFGIATLLLRQRRLLWLAQIALIIGYTIIISFKLPEFWLHPYGPILKEPADARGDLRLVCARGTTMEYLIVKWLHILSSTVLFGTGLGFCVLHVLHEPDQGRASDRKCRALCRHRGLGIHHADDHFAAADRPVSDSSHGLSARAARGSNGRSCCISLLAPRGCRWCGCKSRCATWLAALRSPALSCRSEYWTFLRYWTALGVVAFVALIVVFYLMVAKPM